MEFKYQAGFGSCFQSEAVAGALPQNQNNPQKPPYGLYAEQLSGTSFTAPRVANKFSWLYRIRPSVGHSEFTPRSSGNLLSPPFSPEEARAVPDQLRWQPLSEPKTPTDFLAGLHTVCGHGNPQMMTGAAVHLYACNQDMTDYFYDADGELLIVPQQGRLLLATELGNLELEPLEIAVIPRGIRFQVRLSDPFARGYICENFGDNFTLPDLGPIGANGLASPRHFLTPTAAFEDRHDRCQVVAKYQGGLWQHDQDGSPLNVVAWWGNYAPYKYDLRLFNTINTVSFDHPDPSIFCVLRSPTERPGVSNIDFVIFPPRWMVAEGTFRPPYYHRNIMSEYMGLIQGAYDAKDGEGFVPGGASLHNCMSAHGPDRAAFEQATSIELRPSKQTNTMAFMFETLFPWQPTTWALSCPERDRGYLNCWAGLERHFSG